MLAPHLDTILLHDDFHVGGQLAANLEFWGRLQKELTPTQIE